MNTEITLLPDGEPCTFEECPSGLFTSEGCLCFKSDHYDVQDDGVRYYEAFFVASGYPFSPVDNAKEMNALIVQPLREVPAAFTVDELLRISQAPDPITAAKAFLTRAGLRS